MVWLIVGYFYSDPTNPRGADMDVRRTPAGGVPRKAHITNLPGADMDVRRTPAGGVPRKAHITNLPGADMDVRRTPAGGVPRKAHIKYYMLNLTPIKPARGAPGPRKRGLSKSSNAATGTSLGSSPSRPKLS